MKICWDNLENIRITYHGNFRDIIRGITYYYFEECPECKEPFLGRSNDLHCTIQCLNSSEKHKHTISVVNTGRKHTEDTLLKMRENNLGEKNPRFGKPCKPHTEEALIKMRESKIGEKNPAWKGGISCEPYCIQWSDKEYKDWLKYERDQGKCQNPYCKGIPSSLCLHHINYIKKDCRPVNLISVCNSCNGMANKDREWHESWYSEIIRRKYMYLEISQEIPKYLKSK